MKSQHTKDQLVKYTTNDRFVPQPGSGPGIKGSEFNLRKQDIQLVHLSK